jgi:hypothetical protein
MLISSEKNKIRRLFKNSLVLRKWWRKKIELQTVTPSVTYELWNTSSICGSGWYIAIEAWKIYTGKIEVSFVIESSRKLTIAMKLEVNV